MYGMSLYKKNVGTITRNNRFSNTEPKFKRLVILTWLTHTMDNYKKNTITKLTIKYLCFLLFFGTILYFNPPL